MINHHTLDAWNLFNLDDKLWLVAINARQLGDRAKFSLSQKLLLTFTTIFNRLTKTLLSAINSTATSLLPSSIQTKTGQWSKKKSSFCFGSCNGSCCIRSQTCHRSFVEPKRQGGAAELPAPAVGLAARGLPEAPVRMVLWRQVWWSHDGKTHFYLFFQKKLSNRNMINMFFWKTESLLLDFLGDKICVRKTPKVLFLISNNQLKHRWHNLFHRHLLRLTFFGEEGVLLDPCRPNLGPSAWKNNGMFKMICIRVCGHVDKPWQEIVAGISK